MSCKKDRRSKHHDECPCEKCKCDCHDCKKKDCSPCKDGRDGRDGRDGKDGKDGKCCDCKTCEACAEASNTTEQLVATGNFVVFVDTETCPGGGIIPPPDSGSPVAFTVERAGTYLYLFEVRGVSFIDDPEGEVAKRLIFDLTVNGAPRPKTRFASALPAETAEAEQVVVGFGFVQLPAGALVRLRNAGEASVTTSEGPGGAISAKLALKSVCIEKDC